MTLAPDRSAVDSQPLAARDGALAVLLALFFGTLYLAFPQTRLNGDATMMAAIFAGSSGLEFHHALFLPLARALDLVAAPADPVLGVPLLLSGLCGMLTIPLVFVFARQLGAERGGSFFAACLFGLFVPMWFFATTIEVHTMHVGAVTLAAVLTLALPWKRPLRSLAAAAAIYPLVYLSHRTSVVMGPGWVFLVAASAERRGVRFSLGRVLFGVGPVLLAVLLVTMTLVGTWLHGELTLPGGDDGEFVRFMHANMSIDGFWYRGWLWPLLPLLPLALYGALATRHRPYALAAQLLLVAGHLGFFLWYAVDEFGAYFLGSAPCLAALTARGADRLAARWPRPVGWTAAGLALVLTGLQTKLAYIDAFDDGWRPADRLEAVRAAIGETGVLFSETSAAPRVSLWLPGIRHDSLHIDEAELQGIAPEALAEVLCDGLRTLPASEPVALDLSNPWLYDRPIQHRRTEPYLRAIEARLRSEFRSHEVVRGSWHLLVIDGPR